jgi:hypothetical protein
LENLFLRKFAFAENLSALNMEMGDDDLDEWGDEAADVRFEEEPAWLSVPLSPWLSLVATPPPPAAR